jgi:hypothetical protein
MFDLIVETPNQSGYVFKGGKIDNLIGVVAEIANAFRGKFEIVQQSRTNLVVDIAGELTVYSIC